MAIGRRRPLFYVGVLSLGFVLGGVLSEGLGAILPDGPAKEIFAWSVTPSVGPVHVDLLIFSLSVGPIALSISVLGLLGVILAYMLARSLF